jgi:hypothetical protein
MILVALAACAHAPAVPRHRPSIAVLGLEPVGAGAEPIATQLTDALRGQVALDDSRFAISHEARGLVELKELASCHNDAPSCMSEIGAYLEVDYMLYGKLERRAEGDVLTLDLMDVAKRINRRALAVPAGGDPIAIARDAFTKLGGRR